MEVLERTASETRQAQTIVNANSDELEKQGKGSCMGDLVCSAYVSFHSRNRCALYGDTDSSHLKFLQQQERHRFILLNGVRYVLR